MNTVPTPSPAAGAVPARAHRPGLRTLLAMVRAEAKMVSRDLAGLIVPFGLPLLILLTSASAAGQEEIVAGRTALDLFVLPLVIVMVVTMMGVLNMPSFLAYYRRAGILRRLAVTPASPMMVLLAQAIVSLLQSAVGIALAAAVAALAYGANPPIDLGAALVALALTTAAMYAVGMIVAAISPTPNSSVAIGLVAFLVLGASGGMFGGRDALPGPVAEIGSHLPFGAGVDALSAAWAGQPLPAGSLFSLAAATLVGAVVAALFFRWE
ncbi:ABC transporter permease [Brachybacterium sp. YJGR34]|uniref:ABC transporter permease n=1 Tax=Brachybacterium sp. YJGR34 TaxID=2059911 RepID=UPI000E09EA5A|nr:ABC transporter permease [Brachybacterium sp. YJGR34]